MSIKYVAFALDGVKGLTPTERLVLISLAEWADDDGVCWYSQDRIAERVEVSRRQVIRLIDKLEARGIIVRLERLQRSVRYQIRCDVAMSHVTSASYDTAMSHHHVTSGASGVTQQGHIRCDTAMSHKPLRTTKLEPSSEPSGGARAKRAHRIPDDFSVTDDLRAWGYKKSLTDAEMDRATERFVNYWQGSGKSKSDWPATWRSWMLREIDDGRMGPKTSNGNGRASPVKETTLERNIRNLHAAFDDEPEPSYDNVYETKGFVRQ